MRVVLAASSAMVVALGAAAMAAAAPVLAPLKPCYVVASADAADRQAVRISGTGFTPSALVDVFVDGYFAATVQAGPGGELPAGSAPAPYVEGPDRRFTVTATERDTGVGASATALVTRLAVSVTPRRASPSTPVRFAGRGFTARRPLWLHYVYRRAERRRVRVTRMPGGACGAFSARRRLFGFVPAVGAWTLQFDQQRRYERRPGTAFVRLRIDVRFDGA